MGYIVVRPRHDDEAEITAGRDGRTFFFDKVEEAQDLADLLNMARIGAWKVETRDVAPDKHCDEYDLNKYKANLLEWIGQMSWFAAKSEVGYVAICYTVSTYAPLNPEGTEELPLLTPRHDLLMPGNRRLGSENSEPPEEAIFKDHDVAQEVAEYIRDSIGVSHLHCAAMAVEKYQQHWNQQAHVVLVSDEDVAECLREAREYMRAVYHADRLPRKYSGTSGY